MPTAKASGESIVRQATATEQAWSSSKPSAIGTRREVTHLVGTNFSNRQTKQFTEMKYLLSAGQRLSRHVAVI